MTVLGAIALAIAGQTPAADSAGADAPAADERTEWRFSVTPYLWMFGMEGDLRANNATFEFDASFSDILENLDFALMARVEAWRGPFGFYVDPLYGELEAEAAAGPIQADLTTELTIVDFGALYRVVDARTAEGRERAVDLSIGGRYYHLTNELDFAVAADRSASDDILDLTIGARFGMQVSDRIGLMINGDVGGFELGSSASDLAWNAQALGSLRCGASGRLWAGYRILDLDDDTGGSRGVEIQFAGPILGYQFSF